MVLLRASNSPVSFNCIIQFYWSNVVISAPKLIRIDFFLFVGIMAILFSGIVMSHYTHHNLSPVTQILMQQTLRTVAFMCGECSSHKAHKPAASQRRFAVNLNLILLICILIPQKHVCSHSWGCLSSVSLTSSSCLLSSGV